MLLPICLLKCWLYVYILLNICPAFMSICLPFLLYVCGFFSKDHAYTSIEDSMAIGDPRVLRKPQQNPHELLVGGRRTPASSSTTTTRGCWHQEDKEDGNLVLRWPRTRLPDPCETPTQPQKTHQNLLKNNVTALSELNFFLKNNPIS